MSASRACAASVLLLGVAFAGVAFGAAGGTELERTTIVELLLVLAGAAVAAAAVLWGTPARAYGGFALAALAALAALTALSVTWSIAPELSYQDAGRMLALLAAFAGALGAARLAPSGAPALLQALLLAATAVAAYALAARVWPSALAENEISNRIGQPFGYWNAVGTTAAMAVPVGLWAGSRRGGVPAARVLAYPALGLAFLAIVLSESRGALGAAAIGAIVWFALVPGRLRSVPPLVLPALAAAPVAAWALSRDAFSTYGAPLSARESVGGEFGLLLLAMTAVLVLAGVAMTFGRGRLGVPVRLRRRAGAAGVAAVCVVPLAIFASAAFSDRGLGGTIGDRVDELTNESAKAPSEGGGRLTETSNSRAAFWREAGHVFADSRIAGTGADTFGIARLRYRKGEQASGHAHGFVPQTLADLGLVGLAVSLALLFAWLAAVARTTRLHPRPRRRGAPARRDWTPDRIAMVALLLVAVVFGLQSAIDWTWFIPGPAVVALAAAGFVAGRGPLPLRPDAGTDEPRADERPARRLPGGRLRAPERPRVAAAAAILVTAGLFALAIWRPEASDRASDRAVELVASGDLRGAAAKAADAEDLDPLSPKPLLVQASVQTAAGRPLDAEATLERAVLRIPGDPQTWLRLATFELDTANRPDKALEVVRGLLYLDPHSKAGRQLFLDARRRAREKAQAAAASRAAAARRPNGRIP